MTCSVRCPQRFVRLGVSQVLECFHLPLEVQSCRFQAFGEFRIEGFQLLLALLGQLLVGRGEIGLRLSNSLLVLAGDLLLPPRRFGGQLVQPHDSFLLSGGGHILTHQLTSPLSSRHSFSAFCSSSCNSLAAVKTSRMRGQIRQVAPLELVRCFVLPTGARRHPLVGQVHGGFLQISCTRQQVTHAHGRHRVSSTVGFR